MGAWFGIESSTIGCGGRADRPDLALTRPSPGPGPFGAIGLGSFRTHKLSPGLHGAYQLSPGPFWGFMALNDSTPDGPKRPKAKCVRRAQGPVGLNSLKFGIEETPLTWETAIPGELY